MDEVIDILTKKVASYKIEATIEMKKILWHDTDHWDELLTQNAEISGRLVLSEFTKNALKKFKK